jgi:hypothetical protein
MKPIYQSLFGSPDGPSDQLGNCYPACIASLLDLDLEDVPHFYQLHRNKEDFLDEVLRFLHARQMTTIRFPYAPWMHRYAPGALGIFSGASPRDSRLLHSVVGQLTKHGWKLIHDPHPEQNGIADPKDVEFLFPLMTL